MGWGRTGGVRVGRVEVCLVICLDVHVGRALRRTRRRGEGNSRLFEANSNCFSSFFFFFWSGGRGGRGGGGGGEEGEEKIREKQTENPPPHPPHSPPPKFSVSGTVNDVWQGRSDGPTSSLKLFQIYMYLARWRPCLGTAGRMIGCVFVFS